MMKLSYLIGILISVLVLSSCGGDSKSSKISLTIIPKSPIVFTGDITLPVFGTTETLTINGPWFRFRYKIENKSEADTVTIVGIETETIDSTGASGVKSSFDPGAIGRTVFTELAPGGSFIDPVYFYVHSLTETQSLRFKVITTFQGWFGTEDVPVDRFRKDVRMTTQ